MTLEKIKSKLEESGLGGLLAAALRHTANLVEPAPRAVPLIGQSEKTEDNKKWLDHQHSAYRVLSRYTSFAAMDILEIGGAQSGESALPFLRDGAASAIVTGLEHISHENASETYNLKIMRANGHELSGVFGPSRFDVIYGLSIVEHISSPKAFLDEVYTVLKPGGLAYFEGNPVWSSSKGHHLWIATWGGPYQGKTTNNYLFSEWPGEISTNPLPDWSQILMSPDEMREYLTVKKIPKCDIDCIIDWVYSYDALNRIHMSDIAEAYTNSKLTVLEANISRSDVAPDVRMALRKRGGSGIDYGISGVSYVLKKSQ